MYSIVRILQCILHISSTISLSQNELTWRVGPSLQALREKRLKRNTCRFCLNDFVSVQGFRRENFFPKTFSA